MTGVQTCALPIFRTAELAEVRAAGKALAEQVWARKTQAQAEQQPVDVLGVRSGEVKLPLAEAPTVAKLRATAADEQRPLWQEWARQMLDDWQREAVPHEVGFEVQTLHLGPIRAIFLAGEVVADYALTIKSWDPATPTLVVAYANGIVAYIAAERQFSEGGYEVNGSHYYYLQPAPFTPEIEAIILKQVRAQLGA